MLQRFFLFISALAFSIAVLAAGSTFIAQNIQASGRVTAVGLPATNSLYSKTYTGWASTTAGTGSVVIGVDCTSNGGASYENLGTITLVVGTVTTSNSFSSVDRCQQVSANMSTLNGTGTSANLLVGY